MTKDKLSLKKIFSRNGLISLIVALCLIFTMLPISNLSVKAADGWDGNVATGFAGGDGTEGNPYQISNAKELAYLANMVNDSTVGPAADSNSFVYANTYFKLTADIYLNSESEYSTWSSTSAPSNNANKWTPIGAADATGDYGVARHFAGIFDGDDHTIYGLYSSTAHTSGTGLFGSARGAVVKNVLVKNAYLATTASSAKYVGGIVGYAYGTETGTTIDNCSFSGDIVCAGSARAGGVVGYGYSAGTLTISNSSATGTLSGSATAGGVVGAVGGNANTKNVTIYNSFSNMNITSSNGANAGGILGIYENKTVAIEIENCHFSGYIDNKYPLLGSRASTYATTSLTNVFYKEGSYTGTATNVATKSGYITATNVAQKTATEFLDGTVTELLNENIDLETATFEWVQGESYPEIQKIIVPDEDDNIATGFAGGDGTEGNPYQISNAAELKYFANMVNDSTVGPAADSNNVYVDTYFKLTADIYLNNESEYSTWSSTSAPSNNANKWTPIGAADATGDYGVARHFGGVFDGNGFTIYGMYCSTSTTSGTGLFGSVRQGTIKNLTVENAFLTSTSQYIGGIVGYAYAPSAGIVINNCGFIGNIICANSPRAGGILGRAYVSGGTLTVSHCWSKGTLKSTGTSGGLVGEVLGAANKELVINNCYTAMDFDSTANSVAGLIGYNGNSNAFKVSISNCHVAGTSTTVYPLLGETLRTKSAPVTLDNVYYVTNSYTGEATNVETKGKITATNVAQKTAIEFSDGTVTGLLNDNIDIGTDMFSWVQGTNYPELKARSNNINNDSNIDISDILELRKYFIGKSDANISEDAKNFYDSRNNAVCDFVKFNNIITDATIYLSDKGSDNNDGKTADSAVKTLAKAVEIASTNATVVIVDTYSIKTTTWPTYDKQLTITGGTFDASGSAASFNINGPVTFDDCTVKFREGTTCYVHANGNKFVINENVTVEGMTNLFGGARDYAVDRTDITVLSGNYYSICGAGRTATAIVNGDTNVVVGGNVNSDIVDVCDEDNRSAVIRGAGITNSIVYGNTYVTIKDNVKSVQIYGGGSSGSRVYGKANLNIEGGIHQSAYAGSSSSVITNAELTLLGGSIDQIFGGSNGTNMTGNTRINLLGGTVTRRVYGGCYNDYSFGWGSSYHVIGNITLYLSSNADFNITSTQGDYGIFACSRYKTAFEDENSVIIYENEAAQEKFESKLGQQDSSVSSIINPDPYDEVKIAE